MRGSEIYQLVKIGEHRAQSIKHKVGISCGDEFMKNPIFNLLSPLFFVLYALFFTKRSFVLQRKRVPQLYRRIEIKAGVIYKT